MLFRSFIKDVDVDDLCEVIIVENAAFVTNTCDKSTGSNNTSIESHTVALFCNFRL